jgi:hypothetical protein
MLKEGSLGLCFQWMQSPSNGRPIRSSTLMIFCSSNALDPTIHRSRILVFEGGDRVSGIHLLLRLIEPEVGSS